MFQKENTVFFYGFLLSKDQRETGSPRDRFDYSQEEGYTAFDYHKNNATGL